jgi:hypothetical protein
VTRYALSSAVAAAVTTAAMPAADTAARAAISVAGVNGRRYDACLIEVATPTIDFAAPLAESPLAETCPQLSHEHKPSQRNDDICDAEGH